METVTSTNEENKRDESPKNDQQKLETAKFFGETAPNSVGSEEAGKKEREVASNTETASNGSDDSGKQLGKSVRNTDNSVDLSQREYEDKVIEEAVRLLSTPVLPEEQEQEAQQEDEEDDEMSRLATKTKVPNKSISRPSLSHINSKIPSELSGQPSVKNQKEDAKYWKSREQELLDRIAALETKAAAAEAGKDKFHGLLDQVAPQRQEKVEDLTGTVKEKENYKTKLQQIEKELFTKQKEQAKEANLKGMKTPDEIISHLKAQNEELRGALAKMTGILRDKTSLCVNQEKKIAALTNQVESLKEVVAITKDLLNIRNMEVQHISNDISSMESKIECERQRHNQMLIKMDEAVKLNGELKKEYENQMKLFQQLRESYEEKIRLMSQNGFAQESKDDGNDEQRTANGKGTQIVGKTSRGSNFKVNCQDT